MKNQLVLITGATSGIGKAAAKELSKKGARVVITARDGKRGEDVKSEIEAFSGNRVDLLICDLASQKSIKDCCDAFKKNQNKLDVLINNAGVWNQSFRESPEGIEETFAVNVLAPYLLLGHLIDSLKGSNDSRVITVSSGLHFGKINFDDVEYRKKFSGFHAYRQSKLAVILLTRLLAQKLSATGIRINCMHPGLVNTKLGRHGSSLFNSMFKLFGKSPGKGADTLIYMASSPEVKNISGEYFENREVKRTTAQSYDLQAAEKLLKIVEEKSGLAISGIEPNSAQV
jgi:NAD(P)-dependent dehydrogenase (short-subunit alcohol dehydrogenase family)